MLNQVLEFVTIGKYIIIGLSAIGAIILFMGIYRGDRESMTKGGYMLLLALVLFVCGHVVLSVAEERAEQRMYQYLESEYGY